MLPASLDKPSNIPYIFLSPSPPPPRRMTLIRPRPAALLLALILSAGCASTPHSNATSPAKVRVTPPTRLRGDAGPEFTGEVRLHIEVLVNADGTPDIRTLKVSGVGAGASHAAIESWIRDSRFRPGTRNGVPVPAVMKMELQSKLVRR